MLISMVVFHLPFQSFQVYHKEVFLFLIYINDLPSCTTYVNLFLFADDTKCLKSITTPVDTTLLQSAYLNGVLNGNDLLMN